ncbi:hypothetical protein TNCV_4265141 [Trichonephila clavipes]|nr:hypothetical protein TNCV_4265141 [Trichonephila clavipes]
MVDDVRANRIDEFLVNENIRPLDWPVRSPDLIHIEHAWDVLGREISACNSLSRTIQGLKTEFLNEWD